MPLEQRGIRVRENTKKRHWCTKLLTFVVTAAVAMAVVPVTASAKTVKLYVDPGHGGKDPGAVSGGVAEKDIALAIGKEVRKAAERQGWKVKMSRDTDVFVPLNERARRANNWGATTYVSIHSNSTGDKSLGNMTIYRSGAGKRLGSKIMSEMDKLTDYKDIGNRKDVRGLAVLRGTKMPSVLVEVLAVSPKKERERLKDPAFRKKAAEAIVKGVAKYEGVEYVPPAKPKSDSKKAESNKAESKKADEKKTESTTKAEPKNSTKSESKNEPKSEKATDGEVKLAAEKAEADEARRDSAEADQPITVAAADRTEEQPVADSAPSATQEAPLAAGWLGSLWRLLTR
jgi:N-acetylmuramoyl-L-alanine amidase